MVLVPWCRRAASVEVKGVREGGVGSCCALGRVLGILWGPKGAVGWRQRGEGGFVFGRQGIIECWCGVRVVFWYGEEERYILCLWEMCRSWVME